MAELGYFFLQITHIAVLSRPGNVREEIAGRRQNNSFCQTSMFPGRHM